MEALAALMRQELGADAIVNTVPWDGAVEACRRRRPDVVVIEAGLGTGDEASQLLARLLADLRLTSPLANAMVFVGRPQDDGISLVDAVRAGAVGVVYASDPAERLISALRAVAAGDAIVSSEHLNSIAGRAERAELGHLHDRDVEDRLATLTARERAVLDCLARALRNDEIAAELSVSPRTVDKHVEHILKKLSIHSRLEAGVLLAAHEVRETT